MSVCQATLKIVNLAIWNVQQVQASSNTNKIIKNAQFSYYTSFVSSENACRISVCLV